MPDCMNQIGLVNWQTVETRFDNQLKSCLESSIDSFSSGFNTFDPLTYSAYGHDQMELRR